MPNFKHLSPLVASFGYFPQLVAESNVRNPTAERNQKFNVFREDNILPYGNLTFITSPQIYPQLNTTK